MLIAWLGDGRRDRAARWSVAERSETGSVGPDWSSSYHEAFEQSLGSLMRGRRTFLIIGTLLVVWLLAVPAAFLVLRGSGSTDSGERLVGGTLTAGRSTEQQFNAATGGVIAVSLDLENPAAKFELRLSRRGDDGTFHRIAAGVSDERPQVIIHDGGPDTYRVQVVAASGESAFRLHLRYPTKQSADPKPGYVTVMFGRSMLGAADSSCRLLPGAVSLFTIARGLRSRGIAATSNATIAQVGTCAGGSRYAAWDELSTLRDTYHWSLVSRGKTDRDISALPARDQREETCGSLAIFARHGFNRTWGMFNYPGGGISTAAQDGPCKTASPTGAHTSLPPIPTRCPVHILQWSRT